MEKVIIITNTEVKARKHQVSPSPLAEKMAEALKKSIYQEKKPPDSLEIMAVTELWSLKTSKPDPNILYCPLTIQLPPWFNFPGKTVYQLCHDVESRRQWVWENLGYKTTQDTTALGDSWLPIIVTSKGVIYGEVIGEEAIPNFYKQPIDLTDDLRQPLYHLAYELIAHLKAPPSVYLLQFSLMGKEIVFDRLWPFPAAPAMPSVGVQNPDLFTCYWYCLTNQPILDLIITS